MQYLDDYDMLLEKRILKKTEITRELKNHYIKFIYYKKTGEKRTAYGTMKKSFIDKNYVFKGGNPGVEAAKKKGYIVYFDLKRGTFRMFNMSRKVYMVKRYSRVKDIIFDKPNMYKYMRKFVPHKMQPRSVIVRNKKLKS